MESVAIIGAGITGLTAGFCLQRRGIPATVYESDTRVGGVIRTLRDGGFLAEFGPNTILETSPKIGQLVRDAGLQPRRLDPDPGAGARYVVRYQRPIAMPGSPAGFLTTELFTAQAKLAVMREPFVPARRDGAEESIAEFVTRRLCREFLDQAIDALVAGIYAGDPAKLSVQHAFPKLAQLEEKYGSMIKGQIFGGRERKRRGEIAKDRAPKFSFDEGLQVLPDTLWRRLGDSVQLGTTIHGLTRSGEGWEVEGDGFRRRHCAVIYAGTAYRLAELRVAAPGVPEFTPFAEIRYPPVVSVVLGYRREDVAHPCRGFGMLIPKVEGFKILGTLFSSALFPNRAPANHLTLTTYAGGERYPELAALSAEELYRIVGDDLRVLLGVKGAPVFKHCVYYPKAIPQYNVGYGRFKALMGEIETLAPGFFLCGHYRDGVSLGDSIVSGINIAERAAKFLAPTAFTVS